MPALVWLASAQRDLATIISYIAERDPAAARRLRISIEQAVVLLVEHPYLFRPGRVPGTRELVAHPNYIVVYRVTADSVEVVAVVHARRRYP